jgi:hypothetical protein
MNAERRNYNRRWTQTKDERELKPNFYHRDTEDTEMAFQFVLKLFVNSVSLR